VKNYNRVYSWRWQSPGLQRHVVSLKYTDVSEVRTASVIREFIALMTERVSTSETSVYFSETTLCYTHLHENLKSHIHSLFRKCFNISILIIARLEKTYTTVEWLVFLLHIREVLASNLGLDTAILSQIFCGYPQPFQANAGIVH
jgi:hypothetical protein